MPKIFEFEGQTFDFPDDVSDQEALDFIGKQGKQGSAPAPKVTPPPKLGYTKSILPGLQLQVPQAAYPTAADPSAAPGPELASILRQPLMDTVPTHMQWLEEQRANAPRIGADPLTPEARRLATRRATQAGLNQDALPVGSYSPGLAGQLELAQENLTSAYRTGQKFVGAAMTPLQVAQRGFGELAAVLPGVQETLELHRDPKTQEIEQGAAAKAIYAAMSHSTPAKERQMVQELKDAGHPDLAAAAEFTAHLSRIGGEGVYNILSDPNTWLLPGNKAVAAAFAPGVLVGASDSTLAVYDKWKSGGFKLDKESAQLLGEAGLQDLFAAAVTHGALAKEAPKTAGAKTEPKAKPTVAETTVPKLQALHEPVAALRDAGIKPEPALGSSLESILPAELQAAPKALDDLSFLPAREQGPAWEGMKQAVKSWETQLESQGGEHFHTTEAFDAAMEPFLSRVDPQHRQALAEKLRGLFVSRAQGRIFLQDAQEMTQGMTPIETITDSKTGTPVELYHPPGGSTDNAIWITRGADGQITGAARSTRGGYEYIVGGERVMDLPGSAGPLYRATKDAGIKSTRTTTPAGLGAQIKAAAKGLDIQGGHDLPSKGGVPGSRPAPDALERAAAAVRGLSEALEPGRAAGAGPDGGGEASGRGVREGVPGVRGEAGEGPGSGVAVPPAGAAELSPEAGALLTKTPDQPVAPIPGYDAILSAREAAKKQPGFFTRLREKLSPANLKTQLLEEEAPIFAAADEVAQAMGVPGKFDAETTPIPKDPRLMLPLLKNVGALARHDSIVLGRVQAQARSEGLLGYVTQYLDLLGGERRMSQAEAKVRELQRQSLTHEIGKRMKRPVSSALGTESKAFTALGDKTLGPEARVKKSGTLEEARYQIGERLAKLKSDVRQNPALEKVLAGKFVKAKKQVAALQAQLHKGEVHPLFKSGKDVDAAFAQFESALSPEQLQRVQELSAYVLDLHRRNLQMAFRPSARFGGSANGLLTPEQYHALSSRLVGPQGTEYAPLNRILDQVEGKTGWQGGAGLTSQQRTWLQKYKTGSKNAPVDPFDAALASSMRLFSDLAHNAAADSIYSLGAQGQRVGKDIGIRKLKLDEKPRADEVQLAVRKKGETIRFAVPAEFGPALLAKSTPELTGLALGTLRRARNLLREGVIQLYPFFAVSNVPVDVSDAMLLGRVHSTKLGRYNPAKYLVGAAHWVAALKQTIAEKPEYMEALWHGALGSTFTHAARAERGASPLPGAPAGVGGAVRGVLETVGQKTEEASKVYGFQEALRRLKELEAKGQKTTNPKELLAAYEAMKFVGTPDVMTHGAAVPEANVLLPFLNVGIQGTARMYRRFIRNPKEFLLPTLATITATEAMLLAWNAQHDDGEGGRELDHVPQDEKDNYWSVILPEKYFGRYAENGRLHRVKIRKPQPVRIFAGPIRDLLAGAFTATNPDYLKTGLNSLTEAQPVPGLHIDPNKPVSSLAKSFGAAQNPLVKLTLEQISNQDFLRGTPIERRAEESRAPSERYDERTSSTAVVLSQMITKAAAAIDRARGGMTDSEGKPRELLQDVVPSPKRIEHGVRTLTGGLGQMALGLVDPIASKFSPQPPRAREPVEQIPILNDLLRRLVTLAPRDSQREALTDAFYDRYDQVDEVVKTFPVLMRSNPERAQEFLRERGISDYGQVRGEYVALTNAASTLAHLYKEARAAKTSAEAKRVNDSINRLLRQVLEERRRRASASSSLPSAGGPPRLELSPALGPGADASSLVPEP